MPKFGSALKANEPAIRRVALVGLLYLVSSFQAMLPIDDPDIWWHLRTGQWIAEHHRAPFADYFSAYGLGKPWVAYSWLFELLVYFLHDWFGLAGLVYFTVAMVLLITFALHQWVRLARLPVVAEVALTALALTAMKPLMSPRPWLFTILFFVAELIIISRVRESGKERLLWFLPLLFLFWANLHIQFVYGLAVLGLLLLESLSLPVFGWFGYRVNTELLSSRRLAQVCFISLIATLVSPYHFLLYRPVLEYVTQSGAFQNISELQPMFFRSPSDWLVLTLTLTAVFALGWRRQWLPFPMLVLVMGVFLAFRARRDAWVLVLGATGIISDFGRYRWLGDGFTLKKGQASIAAALVALSLYLLSYSRQITEANLQAVVERKYPAKAVEYLKKSRPTGPMFNTLDWGGFLIWSLPELPVAIDGRTNLHGDARVEGLLHVWLGYPGWDANQELLKAGLIIADKQRPLTSLLRMHPLYKIVFEDQTAVVFAPAR